MGKGPAKITHGFPMLFTKPNYLVDKLGCGLIVCKMRKYKEIAMIADEPPVKETTENLSPT
jgi:hypothetical protein